MPAATAFVDGGGIELIHIARVDAERVKVDAGYLIGAVGQSHTFDILNVDLVTTNQPVEG